MQLVRWLHPTLVSSQRRRTRPDNTASRFVIGAARSFDVAPPFRSNGAVEDSDAFCDQDANSAAYDGEKKSWYAWKDEHCDLKRNDRTDGIAEHPSRVGCSCRPVLIVGTGTYESHTAAGAKIQALTKLCFTVRAVH